MGGLMKLAFFYMFLIFSVQNLYQGFLFPFKQSLKIGKHYILSR